jgi:ribosomal protein S18 acetylase RimI-like enzyme
VLAPLIELDAEEAGAFYINDVAVFPEYRHARIIARKLIELAFAEAKNADLTAVSLTTFEEGCTRRCQDRCKQGRAARGASAP